MSPLIGDMQAQGIEDAQEGVAASSHSWRTESPQESATGKLDYPVVAHVQCCRILIVVFHNLFSLFPLSPVFVSFYF